ncbi:ABC transporter ATP-binding protein [Marinomonas colpomeniae]|uniref:Spermidine/putrescine import ATP-binding protein PotA n=1 Tax=Marinomonas colpomeniae TaxID=2774408 RepID=A0ABR8NZ23_9GAMM|nr:ABC transporter ATP-binding protein [Marinomonas colpomeniae]MBD5771297.1 ABC transporter ATP-binding protein [Marinomonas colpomeniae]
MQSPSIAVEAKNITKVFGHGKQHFRALNDVSVSIRENEFFTLLGPSGCGKTTLLRMFAGFEHPTQGAILLHGKDIAHLPPFQRPINTVFQNYALFPHMTVAKNIAFGLEMLGKPKAEIEETVDRMLDLVQMQAMRDRVTSQISGGQQQRVALARALAPSPKVLLLDEPLSALDYKLRKEMQIELKRLQHETGITFIFVTHDQEEALTMSDRIAVMSGGRILQVGSPHDIYERPAERFVADFIGETNFLEGKVSVLEEGDRLSVTLDAGTEGKQIQVAFDPQNSPETVQAGQRITLTVRPEHAQVFPIGSTSDDPIISGKLENIVYFGTDTHYHVKLSDNSIFIVRQQNSQIRGDVLVQNEMVNIHFSMDSARTLWD